MNRPENILLKNTSQLKTSFIHVPGSKSESNRVLILMALSGKNTSITNLSTARDTRTLRSLLNNNDEVQNVHDAGTTMRFLTAYYAITKQQKVLTGTLRMQERPIRILIDALRQIGCEITYLNNTGFPPIRISGFKQQKSAFVSIPGNVSSQYISALIMVAPALPNGLSIELTGKTGSKPYIEMTLNLISQFGVTYDWKNQVITIPGQPIECKDITIEPDWSGASYWFAFVALANNAEIFLPGLKNQSLQGDKVICEIMAELGVKTIFDDAGIQLSKIKAKSEVSIDFTDCPDLAQTIAVVCAAKKIKAKFTGIRSLRIKETDRIAALQNELSKINCTFVQTGDDEYKLVPGDTLPKQVVINTCDDHRMVMAFAPLCTLMDVEMNHMEVVEKSYPSFWSDVANSGVELINI